LITNPTQTGTKTKKFTILMKMLLLEYETLELEFGKAYKLSLQSLISLLPFQGFKKSDGKLC
jgi:hypothetical protein